MSAEVQVAPSRAPQVRGENLQVVYRKRAVLNVTEITLPAGKTYALLGASGAGKSTLLRVLGMLEKPSSGAVYFDGESIASGSLSTRRRIAAVFQKPFLIRGTVADNVGYGLGLRGIPVHERSKRITRVLARVGLKDWEQRSALTLSGGEAQRVALARALVLEPQLLLLDEPLSYMDPLLKRQLTLEFAEILADQHLTTLYVTHDQDEAAIVADRIGVMREGILVAEGSSECVLALPPDEWVASFLGTEQPIEGVVAGDEDGILRVNCRGTEVFGVGDAPTGTRVLLGVRPEDVVLLESDIQIPHTSARNRLDSRVVEVVRVGALSRVVLESGRLRFAASVSHLSAVGMNLAPGVSVTAMFKAAAVRVQTL
jgi:molybdopterin-binding protein